MIFQYPHGINTMMNTITMFSDTNDLFKQWESSRVFNSKKIITNSNSNIQQHDRSILAGLTSISYLLYPTIISIVVVINILRTR